MTDEEARIEIFKDSMRRILSLIDKLVAERDGLRETVVRQEQRIATLTEEARHGQEA